MTTVTPITDFRGPYLFLSNFSLSRIVIDGVLYPMVEHAFQAMKTFDRERRRQIAESTNPSRAKFLGRSVDLRQDWESVKFEVMLWLLRRKFANAHLAGQLLATGDAPLIEDTTERRRPDLIWGACRAGDEWFGQNHLGRLLEQVRTEIRTSTQPSLEEIDEALMKLSRPYGVAA